MLEESYENRLSQNIISNMTWNCKELKPSNLLLAQHANLASAVNATREQTEKQRDMRNMTKYTLI